MTCPLARIALTRIAFAFVLTFAWAHAAEADIIQEVYTAFWTDPDRSGDPAAEDSDHFHDPPGPPRDILAQISGSGYQAVSAAGIFGNLGMQGSHEAAGFLETDVAIKNTAIVNPFSEPCRVRANFIIDGGRMRLAGPVASLHFNLQLGARKFDAQGNLILESNYWRSEARLRCENSLEPELILNDSDIGIHMIDPFTAEIPSSFQTFEIGVVPSGGWIELGYLVYFESSAIAFEFSEFQYSDPLNVSGEGEFPTIEFVPVPEPRTLLALGAALLALPRRRGKSWLTFPAPG